MDIIIAILKSLLISKVVVMFSPLQLVLSIFEDSKYKLVKIICMLITELITCFSCASFWISLLMWHDLYISCVCYLLAFIYNRFLQKYENKLE